MLALLLNTPTTLLVIVRLGVWRSLVEPHLDQRRVDILGGDIEQNLGHDTAIVGHFEYTFSAKSGRGFEIFVFY